MRRDLDGVFFCGLCGGFICEELGLVEQLPLTGRHGLAARPELVRPQQSEFFLQQLIEREPISNQLCLLGNLLRLFGEASASSATAPALP